MLATPTYLISDLTRGLDELTSERRILAGMNDDLGVSFVDAAEVKVRQQIAKAAGLDTPILKARIEKALKDQHELEDRVAFHEQSQKNEVSRQAFQEEVPTEFLATKAQGIRTPTTTPSDKDQIPASQESQPRLTQKQPRNRARQRKNINPPPPSTQTYYYYQTASGLPIYLHPLDIRILLSHFSSYSAFPDDITVRVEAFSESTIDDDLRKRCKYLAHMPEGADVVFIEADLEGVVGAQGLKSFEGALKSRTARRKEKGKKDDRAKAKAEERDREKDKMWTSSASHSIANSHPITIHDSRHEDDYSALIVPPSQGPGTLPSPSPSSSQQQQNISGAWGARSFASALHSPPTRPPSQGQQRSRPNVEDEWDMDVAWHELEQKTGGRKKKNTKLVVLGGTGGRRR